MAEQKETPDTEKPTGRYVYDKKLGKVVKVSDDIPGLKKGGSSGPPEGGCPINPAGRIAPGTCGAGGAVPGGHACNGCCGH